jgi:hypothetical protein
MGQDHHDMRTVWMVLISLGLVLPVAAFVAGSFAASSADEPAQRDPIVIPVAPADPGRPEPSRTPDRDDPAEVVTPQPRDVEGAGDDDDDDDDGAGGDDDDDDTDDRAPVSSPGGSGGSGSGFSGSDGGSGGGGSGGGSGGSDGSGGASTPAPDDDTRDDGGNDDRDTRDDDESRDEPDDD